MTVYSNTERASWPKRRASGPAACLAGALLACASVEARADGLARVTLEVDRSLARVGEPLQVTVSISVSGRMGYDQFVPPRFDGFQVGDGGSSSQQIQIVNGHIERTEQRSFTIVPIRAGTLDIGPAAVVLGGRTIRSNRVRITVKQGTGMAPAPSPLGQGVAPPDQAPAQGGDADVDLAPEGAVFISAVAEPKHPVVGQQVTVTWYLFTQSQVLQYEPVASPSPSNAWVEDLESARRIEYERKFLRGQPYLAAVLQRKAIFPKAAGEVTVSPLSARLQTADAMMSGGVLERSSPTLPIKVLPLPEKGKPAGFVATNVGSFDMAAMVDRNRVPVGEGVTLELVISGQGNIRQITPPELPQIDGLRQYKPKVDDRVTNAQVIAGEKHVEYLLIPSRPGRITIPSLSFEFYAPSSSSYRRAVSAPIEIEVTGQAQANAGADPAAGKNILGPNIRPPRPFRPLESAITAAPHRSTVVHVLLGFPLMVYVAWFLGERVRSRLRRETSGSLRRAALRTANAHLAAARRLHGSADGAAVSRELLAAIHCVLRFRLKTPVEGMTRDELADTMGRAGSADEVIKRTRELLDECDTIRFGGARGEDGGAFSIASRAEELLHVLSSMQLRKEG